MWHWLIHTGHVFQALIGWIVGFTMASFLGVGISRPIIVRVKEAWRSHEKTQEKIAHRLDTNTPGGLGTVVARLDEQTQKLQEQSQKLEQLHTTLTQEESDGRGQE